MMQTLDRQLQVVLRALGEVVAPALSGADGHVQEQLQLSMATLGFVAARMPDARRFARYELRSYVNAARAAAEAAAGLGEPARVLATAADAGAAALERPDAEADAIEQATRTLRDEVTALAAAARGTPAGPVVERSVLDACAPVIEQSRQWCAPFGFEIRPADLAAPAW